MILLLLGQKTERCKNRGEICKDDVLCKRHHVTPEKCNMTDFNELDFSELCPKTCHNCNPPGKGNFRVINVIYHFLFLLKSARQKQELT